jgi:hypothetical protein
MLLEPRSKLTSCVQFLLLKLNSRVLWRTVHAQFQVSDSYCIMELGIANFQVSYDRQKSKFVCVFVENSCHGDAVVTDGRESVFCWLLTETHRHGFLSHFCTASAIGNSGITLCVITINWCVLLLLAVYVCSFQQDWSHTCGSYRCVEIEFIGTVWAVNWLA